MDRMCDFCKVPKAMGSCPHIIRYGGQVTMSEKAFDDLSAELWQLRCAKAAIERGMRDLEVGLARE